MKKSSKTQAPGFNVWQGYSLKTTGDFRKLMIDRNTGQVQLINSADYETQTTYNFVVIATLNLNDSTSTAEEPVTLTINDVNDCLALAWDNHTHVRII